ncbi:MAG: TolC family protein [Bacteroidales bacterium]|nr:TolC family protein [Bacteroidales bacterium]
MRSAFIGCLLLLAVTAPAQHVLDAYVKTGLENNLALLQKESGYRQSLELLREARGLFYPSVSLNARYTRSEGGRVIEFPVGTLLNSVYNQLGMPVVLEDEEIRFLRPAEHETKIRLVQPLINSDVYYNSRIRKELSVAEEISLEQYKRELTADIRKAYYSVGMTGGILGMLQETKLLLLENVRVNEKLIENGKTTLDNLYRSQTELSKFEQTFQEALKNREIAKAWFNFLLNRPLSDSVIIEIPDMSAGLSGNLTNFVEQAVVNREEVLSLEQYLHVADLSVSMNRTALLPNITAVADYGFQGEKYAFNRNTDYLQASLVLSWDLFSGFQQRAKINQALMGREKLEHQLDEVRNQVSLQVIRAFRELKSSEAGITAAENQLKTAREGFRLVKRRYDEGQASLIEFIDARSTLTQAEENLIVSRYKLLIDQAEFEKVVAANKQ